MSSKSHKDEAAASEMPEIAKVSLDVGKKLLNPNVMFFEVIEANPGEYSVVMKTRTGEITQYRVLTGGEKIQIFDGEKEIE